jgi:hypothetical protein
VRSRAHCLAVLSLCALTPLAASRTARAQPADAGPASPAARRVVALDVRGGSPDDARLLEVTIRELLARLGLATVSRFASAGAVLANAEVDLTGSGTAHVVVRNQSGATILDESVPRDPNPAIEREKIALAVRGAAEAELLAEEDRVSRRAPAAAPVPTSPAAQPPAPPAPAPSAPAAPPPAATDTASGLRAPERLDQDRGAEAREAPAPGPRTFALDVSTVAGVGLVADHTPPVARVGGAVALASRRGLRPSVGLGALFALPFDSGNDTLSSHTTMVSLRGLGSLELTRTARFALQAGGGAGVDVLSVAPSSKVLPGSSLGSSSTRADPVVSATVTAQLALAPDVVLVALAVADFDLTSRHYVFDDQDQRSDVLAPWNVRPTLLVGLSFNAFGDPAFDSRGRR